jgi:hypothetical protein
MVATRASGSVSECVRQRKQQLPSTALARRDLLAVLNTECGIYSEVISLTTSLAVWSFCRHRLRSAVWKTGVGVDKVLKQLF